MTSNCDNMGTYGEVVSLFYIGVNPIKEQFVAVLQRKANIKEPSIFRENITTPARWR
jgi:hypothetical protein